MAVAYKASGALAAGVGAVTPAFPTGGSAPAAGDIAILVVESENEAISLTTANGFVEVGAQANKASGPVGTAQSNRIAVYWKRCVGSDSAPVVADPGNHATAAIHLFSGAIDTGNPWDVISEGTNASSTSLSIPGATTTVADTLVLLISGTSRNATSTNAEFSGWTNADLTSITEHFDAANTAGLGGGHALASGVKASAGAYGTTTATVTTATERGVMTIALKPAPTVPNEGSATGTWTFAGTAVGDAPGEWLVEEHFENGTLSDTVDSSNSIFSNPTSTATFVSDGVTGQAGEESLGAGGGTMILVHPFSVKGHVFVRIYHRVSADLGQNTAIVQANTAGAASILAQIQRMPSGGYRIRNALVATATGTEVLPVNDTWVRFEWEIDSGTNTQELSVFHGANLHGTTPDETISGSYTGGANIEEIRLGALQSNVNVNIAVDAYAISDTQFPPPEGGGAPNEGTATGTWTFAGAATGKRTPKASATGTFAYVGTAVGKRTPKASGTGTWTFVGTAVGKRTPKASATGAWTFAGAAVGKKTQKGTASGTWTFAGSAAGKRAPKASSTGTWTFASVAVGDTPPNDGSASGTWTFAGAAVGKKTPKATATGTFTYNGFATASTIPQGYSTGLWTFTGTAVGKRAPKAAATGTWTFSGVAVGKRAPKASATGTFAYVGTAVGKKTQKGSATGAWSFAGTASGKRTPKASATETWTFAGAAVGDAPNTGSATGAWAFAGTAAGKRTPKASATGTFAYTGTAVGYRQPEASATGAWTFAGTAIGSNALGRIFSESYEGGAPGTDLTTLNSGFDIVLNTPVTFETTPAPLEGSQVGRYDSTSANIRTKAVLTDGAIPKAFARWYTYLESGPSAVNRFFTFETDPDASPPGEDTAALRYTTARKIGVYNGTDFTTNLSTTTIPLSEWVRYEVGYDRNVGTHGQTILRIFHGANVHGTTPDEEITVTHTAHVTNPVTTTALGNLNIVTQAYSIDAFEVDTDDWIGPLIILPNEGSASGSWAFSGATTGKRTPKAVATGTFAYAGTTVGKRTPKAVATGTWTFAGTATGKKTPKAAATGTWTFTGAATGKRTPKASASGTWTFSGSAVGDVPPNDGTATGTWTFAGTAVGYRQPEGSASGVFNFAGLATGDVLPNRGLATGTWTFTGTAVGKRAPKASATGTWTFSGAAIGKEPAKGSASGAWSFSGAAVGKEPAKGSATGTWTFSGTAVGKQPSKGSATGIWTFTGTAVGDAPPNDGTATGAWAFNGTTIGKRTPKAASTGTWTFTGTASGKSAPKASATGTWAYNGFGSSVSTPVGYSTGLWSFSGEAVGERTPEATAAGSWVFNGAAGSAGLRQGSATGAWEFSGTATGKRAPKAVASSGVWTFTGTATGSKFSQGSASSGWGYLGTATGARSSYGSATGAWLFTGTAGSAGIRQGSATGAWAFSGAAIGKRVPKAVSLSGVWTFTGSATGSKSSQGLASSEWGYLGTATGARLSYGSATGAWLFTGAAAGTLIRSGTAVGLWLFEGTAVGLTGPFIPEPTPEERTYNVPGEVRVFIIDKESRVTRVPLDTNRSTIEPEERRTVPVRTQGVIV